jgi:excisionase family DNA binding protein
MNSEAMWSHEQTAEYLGVAPQTLYFLNHQGKGPKRYKVGRYNRYRKDEVDAWLEARCVSR